MISVEIDALIWRLIKYLSFLLFTWIKSNKNSRLNNNAGVSKPKVSPRNTRHERTQQILTSFLAGVLLRTCHPHKPLAKNRRRIFIMPVPSKKVYTYGNMPGHGFGLTAGFWGCGDRPYKISVVVRGRFYERGAFQAMQKWAPLWS